MDDVFVGIDVSKDRLDGCIRGGPSFQHDNSPAGIAPAKRGGSRLINEAM